MEIEFHQMELKYEGLRVKDARREAALMASLVQHGQLNEVLVVRNQEGRYVLIDGYRRVEALRRLGRDTVKMQVLAMGEPDALVYSYRLGRGAKRTALEEGWFLRELSQVHQMNQVEMAAKLQRSSSWICRRLALVQELPEVIQELVRKGKICAWAAGKFLVPLARAKRSDCLELVEGIKNAGLSARQIGKLYEMWRSSGPRQRQILVKGPLIYLKAQEEMARSDPPLEVPSTERSLAREIEALGGMCRGMRKKLKQYVKEGGMEAPIGRLHQAWQETRMDIEALMIVAKEILDAGRADACGDPCPA